MSDEDWDEVITTNLRSVFLFSRAASAGDDAGAFRTDYQYVEHLGRSNGERRAVELRSLEGGDYWFLDIGSPRTLAAAK